MKKYDNYKDSGIEWIGEIPSHWEVCRFKYSYKFVNERSELDIPKIGLEHIESWTGRFIKNKTEFEGDGISFQEQDILFGKLRPYLAKVYLAEFAGKAVGDFFVFRPESNIQPEYGYRFLLSRNFIEITNSSTFGSKMPRVSPEFISNLDTIIPSFEEQTAIANYLDRKTTEIDELIADKKCLLELYEEEKTAIINQAVTKGINPNVPMKDSGIEWLGEIPEHWEVKQFRHCITILTDFTANGSFASLAANVNYLSSGYSRLVRLTDLRVNLSNEGIYVDEHAHNFLSKSELFGGEILLANVGAYAGLVIQMPYFEGKFTLGPNMFLIRVNQNSDYMNFMLNSAPVNSNLRNIALSSAQPKLNKDDIKGLRLVLPPIHEQDLIVNWLNIECARIDAKKAKTEKLIELLTEYRTALISEVVTGKIKVI